jgi:hypothetical protein
MQKEKDVDVVTVIAIAVVAYVLANVIHEGLGHGGACLLFGGKATQLSSLHFSYEETSVTAMQRRIIAAAGSFANVVAAVIGLLAFRAAGTPRVRYFGWLFTTINLLMPAGYFLFSGVLGIGDWVQVFAGVRPLVWRPLLALAGAALYYAAARFSATTLAPITGDDLARAKRLLLVSYVTGGILYCASGLFNPLGPLLIAISGAAASFGGTSGLVWMDSFIPPAATPPIAIVRSIAWIAASAVLAALFLGVLGPGLTAS